MDQECRDPLPPPVVVQSRVNEQFTPRHTERTLLDRQWTTTNHEQNQRLPKYNQQTKTRDCWKEYSFGESEEDGGRQVVVTGAWGTRWKTSTQDTPTRRSVVLGREHITKNKKRNGSTPLFSTPPRIPTEVNLIILITVKDKPEKMKTPVFKKRRISWMENTSWLTGWRSQPMLT